MKDNFQVDLRGIVEILSHHLYSSPRVYLRELIQNARDAVVARAGSGTPWDGAGRAPVEILVDGPGNAVVVRDHGIGLTEDDARTLLSTIGASSKRGNLAETRTDYLGQFGIGLLSCFLVADEIVVRSRSALDPAAPTMRWVGYGDGTFTVATAQDPLAEPGTEVRVHARPDDAQWVAADRVRLLAREFARLLPVPITLRTGPDDAPVLVSDDTPPWELDGEAAAGWCVDAFGFTPLAAIPLELGVLGVRGRAFVTGSDVGNHARSGDLVYSRGMLVADANTQLLPEWATFLRAAVEAGDLPLTASREALQSSGTVEDVRAETGRQIRAGLERLAAERPDVFAHLVRVHGQSLLAMAATDEQMLDLVARHLHWETSAGPLRLVEMPRDVTYAERLGDFNAYAALLAARGGLLVNGAYAHGVKTLRAYDRSQSRTDLRRFDLRTVLEDLPQARSDDHALAERIITSARRVTEPLGVAVEVRDFAPDSLMVLHLPARGGGFDPDPGDDAPSAGDPWDDLLSDLGPVAEPDGRARLVLNLRSPAVRAVGGPLTVGLETDAVRALHLLGLLQSGHRLDAEEQAGLADALRALLVAASASAAGGAR